MTTPFLDQIYARVDFDRELVFKFFTVFSLFEWALKQNEEFRSFRNGKLEANWKAFAENIHPSFEQDDVRASVDYFFNTPPKKQILVNEFLDYKEEKTREESKKDEPNDTVWLSIMIRRVRNNLFHGGKFGYRPERDTPLIIHSLLILETWAHCHPDIKRRLANVE
jgi:hypothetical protein